ncbi:hypothetical protein L4D13_15100 [Photobacterium profundum]|uniref:rolling circle replication-associated protein n=1 Tax=Photobacterium profundum TaxID=74109 RepID=UPI003D12EDB7
MLPLNDFLYVAGSVQPVDKTKNNQAAYDSGFLGFHFCGPQLKGVNRPLDVNGVWELNRVNRDTDFFANKQKTHTASLPNYNATHLREAAARSDENNRLVQGRKSPTHPQQAALDRILRQERKLQRGDTVLSSTEAFYNHDTLYELAETNETKPLSTVRLMNRNWSNQYRVLHHTQTRPSNAPEAQSGERYTEKLTQRAVTKIFESGAYVAACHDGFTTFLTPTFSPEQREKIFSGETTIGKEVSRFLDGIKKMYQRGWHGIDTNSESFELEPIEKPFHYIWVAECPANDDGEPNPHVHILLQWTVEREYFEAWASRIENIWGHGFAKLEKIRHTQAAGSYIIKAVGYAAKGGNANQGLIKGNRYNIARCSRAPGWDCLASFETGNMAAIIKELGYKLEQWRKPIDRFIRRLQKQHDQTIKAKAIAKQAKKPKEVQQRLSARLAKIEHQMRASRDQLKSRGVYASTKNIYCASFDGEQAEEKAFDFLLWAAGARGWSMESKSDDDSYRQAVNEAKQLARIEYASKYKRFKEKRAYWQSVLNDPLVPNETDNEAELAKSMLIREQYETQALAA